ncbi:MAG: hypothetical protein ACREDH_01580, partial [Methylocella sp.]
MKSREKRAAQWDCTQFIVGDREILWGRAVQWLVGIGAIASLAALMCRLCAAAPLFREPPVAGRSLKFCLLLLGLQLLYCFATTPILFDRHLLIMAPTVLTVFCLLCRETRSINWIVLLCGLAPMAFYSVAATHDLHGIARTAFAAGDDLISSGVDPKH